ncbi:MAG: zinc-ribbon domain-containing protein [Thermoplasmata archaeon]|nr:zinc-ribbon domain-containing protein [Thermoplasmata archaeon]
MAMLVSIPISVTSAAPFFGTNNTIKAANDLVVDTTVILDRSTAPSGILGMDGNITINSGGNLTVKNIEIQFLQDGGLYPVTLPKKYFLKINSGGILYLENSTISVSTKMVNPYLKFNLSSDGGKIVMKNSKLAFPGYLYLVNSEVYMNSSQITGLSEMPSVWQNEVAKIDDNDDAPIISALNSKIYVADSIIEKYYENVNIVDFQLTPKDFPGYIELQPSQTMTISQLDVSEITYDKLSRVSLQVEYTTTPDYNGTNSFQVSYNGGSSWQNLPLTPQNDSQASEVVPLAVTTLSGLTNLRFRFTHNGNTGNITITRFDVIVRPGYEFNMTLSGTTQMTVINSNISIDWDTTALSVGTSNKLVLYNSASLELLNVRFDEEETPPVDANGHGQKYAPAIITYNSSQVFVYRWARIPVYDQNKMPISNAQLVSLEYTPASSMIQYTVASRANDLNAHPMIKMYLTANGITNRSNAQGIITYPVASDYINVTTLPNSLFIGSYVANCTYLGTKRGTGIITLPAYPDMVGNDNVYTTSPVGISIDLPNLKITSVFTSPSQPLKGDMVNLTARVENSGLATAKGVTVRFLVNGIEIGDAAPADVMQGGSQNFVYPYTFDYSGQVSITAIADPDNLVSEMDENDNNYSAIFSIAGRPSLVIEYLFVLVGGAPSESVNVNQTAEIRATIRNNGDGIASSVSVQFKTEAGIIGTDTISTIPIGESRDASVSWKPSTGTAYTITAAIVSSSPSESDADKGDNSATKSVIITYPNLLINLNTFSFSPEPAENRSTTISVEIYNDGNGFASNVVVVFKTDSDTIGTKTLPRINAKSTSIASVDWYLPVGYGGTRNVSVQITSSTEGAITEEMKTSTYVKYAPRLSMETKVWFYDEENNLINSVQPGTTVIIRVNITNAGDIDSSEVNVDFYLDGLTKSNYIGKVTVSKVPGVSTVVCEYRWIVSVQKLNLNHTIYAKVNNTLMNASNSIFVERLIINWEAPPYISTSYDVNQDYVITGRISTPVPMDMSKLQVQLSVTDTGGNLVGNYPGTFATDGSGLFTIPVRFDKSGTYTLTVVVSGDEVSELRYPVAGVSVVGGAQGPGISSMMLWLIVIIVIIVVVVIIAFILISRAGIGKLGECGECGAPIPENATKCPKCGAEFETSTVRCSECGAWIPASTKTCPECGTVFSGKKVEASSYEKTMRQQYEAYVDKYRAQAKREMGGSFSETAFWRWWRTQPSYMTYNQWLHKEEATKRETTKCPSCGAVNERGARVCYRCGTAIVAPAPVQRGLPSQQQEVYTPPQPEERYRPPQQPEYTPAYQPPQAQVYAPPTQPPAPRPERPPAPAYAPPPAKPVVLKSTPPSPPPTQQPPVPTSPVPPKKVIKRPEAVEPTPEKPAGKLCPKCGKEISAEFVVCPYCGAIVR